VVELRVYDGKMFGVEGRGGRDRNGFGMNMQ
jgi:hypothetical protein